jgi:hypothetical protein
MTKKEKKHDELAAAVIAGSIGGLMCSGEIPDVPDIERVSRIILDTIEKTGFVIVKK